MGRWSLSPLSSYVVQSRSGCKSRVMSVRSICDLYKVPFALNCSKVCSSSSKMFRSFSSMKFSIVLPLLFVVWSYQSVLWLLKSPVIMYGLGSCLVSCSRSVCVKSWSGLIYMLHIAMRLCRYACIAMA